MERIYYYNLIGVRVWFMHYAVYADLLFVANLINTFGLNYTLCWMKFSHIIKSYVIELVVMELYEVFHFNITILLKARSTHFVQ